MVIPAGESDPLAALEQEEGTSTPPVPEEANPDHEAVRTLFSSVGQSVKEFWSNLTPSGKKTYTALGFTACALTLVWAGTQLANPETEQDETPPEEINPTTDVPGLEIVENASEEPVLVETSEIFDIGMVPAEHWQRSKEAENYVKEIILKNSPDQRPNNTVADRTLEALRGVYLKVFDTPEGQVVVRLDNPIHLELSDPSNEHEALLAFGSWHPQSQKMIYFISGYIENGKYVRDDIGHELWSFRPFTTSPEDPHTPQFIFATPLSFGKDHIELADESGYFARGRFGGETIEDMVINSVATIYADFSEAIEGLGVTYNIRHDSERLFRDMSTADDLHQAEKADKN